MRTIIIGIIVFILWSALCTRYYLRHIKGPAVDETTMTEQPVNETAPAARDSLATAMEAESAVPESPGTYTVYHEFNRSEIKPDPEFDVYIEKLAEYTDKVSGSELKVVGHTDNIGSENYNNRLGMKRAQSTMDYLVKMGISEQIISISSEGESSPQVTNETEQGRAQNRRTEIHIDN